MNIDKDNKELSQRSNRSGSGCPMHCSNHEHERLGRRGFLSRVGTAGGAALAMQMGLFNWSARQVMAAPMIPGNGDLKPRILVGFSRPDRDKYWMGWPGAAYDIAASQARYTEILTAAAKRLNVDMAIEHEPLTDAEAVDAFMAAKGAKDAAGALLTVMSLNEGWPAVDHFLEERDEGLPTIVFAPQGVQFTPWLDRRRDIPNCFVGSTYDIEWLDAAMQTLKARWQMQQTRFAVIRGDEEREEKLEPVGTVLHHMPLRWFVDAYRATEGA